MNPLLLPTAFPAAIPFFAPTILWRSFLALAGLCALLASPGFALADSDMAQPAFPLLVVDALGRRVEIARSPGRIVSLTPSNTETLFAVGAGARVVGVTQYCNYPEEAKALPKVGGFSARTISVEVIVALHPSLVVAGDENHRQVIEALEQAGIPVISVKVRSFEELYSTMLLLGRVTGDESQAEKVVAGMRARAGAVERRVAGIPAGCRKRVYWEVFDEPLMSAGSRGIIGQQIALAGGINIFSDVGEEYPQISAEVVIQRDPQVILGPRLMRARSLSVEKLRERPGWGAIAAVAQGRVAVLPDEPVSRPGPRLVEGLEMVAREIYP